ALGGDALSEASRDLDANKRSYDVVNLYLNAIRTVVKRDESPKVIVCVVPEEVWMNCRPESRVPVAVGIGERIPPYERSVRRTGQTNLFVPYDPQPYPQAVGFRQQRNSLVIKKINLWQIIKVKNISK